ncbi:MAG TPA: CsgG/HfaB family protein [Planctomycetota bacterium]|nr:CsgG/HfaB family protein [Planctomycetota bacterium]
MLRAMGAAALWVVLTACGTSTSETYSKDSIPDIGNYPPPPPGYTKVRAAVMKLQDKTNNQSWHSRPVGEQAAEQLETLLVNSGRFNMIERLQLENVLKEQGLANVVDPNELARPGRVRGVDYLFLGSITEFSIKVMRTRTGGGIFDRILPGIAPLDIDTSKTEIETRVAVDIKLVNTTTGEIVAKDAEPVKRVDTASAWGVRVLGIGGDASKDIKVDAESQGRIMRYALDQSLKRMLPAIDAKFSRPQPSYCPHCKTELAAGQNFCTKCGKSAAKPKCKCGAELESGAKFCGACGSKVEGAEPAPSSPQGRAPSPAPASGDYLPEHAVLARAPSGKWYACIVKTPAEGEKKEVEFQMLTKNETFKSERYHKTRPAKAEDIKIGATVFVPNVFAYGRDLNRPGAVVETWKESFSEWQETTVTGVKGGEQGLFQAPVYGEKDIHFSNVRVAVKE